MKEELAKLQEVKNITNARISYLQQMCDPKDNMYARDVPFHPLWHTRAATMQEIGKEILSFSTRFTKPGVLNMEDLQQFYQDYCYPAEEEEWNTLSDVRFLNKMNDDTLAILNERKENSAIKIQAMARGNQARGMMALRTSAASAVFAWQDWVSLPLQSIC
jgi:hypothetical protein